ncbi:MAG: RNA polymerase sigma factor [Planctomycetota bacterium]
MTDTQLARSVDCGDQAAFDEIVRRYCRPLTLFAVGRIGSVHDAEDIIQETFLRAYQNMDSFNTLYSLKNWLFTIAYRLIVSDYRKKRPKLLSDEAVAQLPAKQPGLQENQWLWQVTQKLGPQAFTALWLRYKQQMSTSEIAQIMNKTKIMVRVLLHRSRIRLAEHIANLPETAEHQQHIPKRAFSERRK